MRLSNSLNQYGSPKTHAAGAATEALGNLAVKSKENKDAIRAAGGVLQLASVSRRWRGVQLDTPIARARPSARSVSHARHVAARVAPSDESSVAAESDEEWSVDESEVGADPVLRSGRAGSPTPMTSPALGVRGAEWRGEARSSRGAGSPRPARLVLVAWASIGCWSMSIR